MSPFTQDFSDNILSVTTSTEYKKDVIEKRYIFITVIIFLVFIAISARLFQLQVLENNKYAKVTISFNVSEVRPYDADSVGRLGSFRGLTTGLYGKMFPEIIRKNDIVPGTKKLPGNQNA